MATAPFFKESLTPDEYDNVRTFYGLQGYARDVAKPAQEGDALQVYEAADEPALKKRAFEKAKKYVPSDAPIEELKKAYAAELANFQQAKVRETQARQGALVDAGQAGMFESPGSILPTPAQQQAIADKQPWQQTREQILAQLWHEGKIPEEHVAKYALRQSPDPAVEAEIATRMRTKLNGAPPKDSGSWLGGVVNTLQKPARAVSSGIGGAIKSIAERAPAPTAADIAPAPDTSGPKSVMDALFNPDYSFTGLAYKGLTGQPLALGSTLAGIHPGDAAQVLADEAQPSQGMLPALAGMAFPPLAGVAALYGLKETFPTTSAAAIEHAKQGFTGPDNSEFSLNSVLEQQRQKYAAIAPPQMKQDALEQAKREVPPDAPIEALKLRYNELLADMAVRKDPALLNPNATRFATEIALDPLNVFPGEEVARGVGKVLSTGADLVPMGKGKTLLDKLRQGFQYAPEYSRLPEAMNDTKALGRLGAEQADIAVDKSMEGFNKPLAELQKVKPADRATLFDAIEGRVPVPEHLKSAVKANQELATTHEALRAETGVGQDWDKEGLLQQPRLLKEGEGYVPHRVETKKAENAFTDVAPEITGDGTVREVMPGSTKERKGGKDYLKDPVAQWEAELSEIRPKAKVAVEMRNMRKYFDGGQQMYSSMVKYSPEESAKFTELMKKETGVEWVDLSNLKNAKGELSGILEERFQRLTGTPGAATKGGTSTFVPRPIAERLKSLVKIADAEEVAGAFSDFNKAFIRPTTKIWRTAVTIPNVAFHTTNAAGSFMLGTIAHGLRSFDPGLQVGAATGALLSALGEGGKVAGKVIPYTLRSGKTLPLSEILRMAEEDGVTNVFHLRQGYEAAARGKNVVTKGLELANKVVDKTLTPMRKVAQLTDDYQHLTAYLGFLEDVTPVARARAAEKTAEFAGNYRRLGEGEKKWLKEGFGFYSWMRFVFPHTAKQLLENPQRIAAYAKLRGYLERENGKAGPTFESGVPGYLQGKSVTAPMSKQPEGLQAALKSGKVPDIGSHDFAMMTIEDPINMGLAWLPMVENLAKGSKGDAHSETMANMLSPYAQAAIELLTGVDLRTGEPIEGIGEHVTKFAKSYVDRPSQAWSNLIKLYSGRPEAMELALRYKVGRDFLGLENMVTHEHRSIPSYPGARLYPVDPLDTGLRSQSNAMDYFKQRLQKRQRDAQ